MTLKYECDEKRRAVYVAKETGISEEAALALISQLGMDLPTLLREARIIARRIVR
jgi:hypothetical protein